MGFSLGSFLKKALNPLAPIQGAAKAIKNRDLKGFAAATIPGVGATQSALKGDWKGAIGRSLNPAGEMAMGVEDLHNGPQQGPAGAAAALPSAMQELQNAAPQGAMAGAQPPAGFPGGMFGGGGMQRRRFFGAGGEGGFGGGGMDEGLRKIIEDYYANKKGGGGGGMGGGEAVGGGGGFARG